MRKETLILTTNLMKDCFYLSAAGGHLIGRFNKIEDAQKFCDENGYRMRINF